MKRNLVFSGLCSVLLAGLLTVSAVAQSNFAGTWELDKAKSKLPEMMANNLNSLTWTVAQDAKEIKLEPKAEMAAPPGGGPGGGGGRGMGMMGGGNQPRSFKLDGSETVAENQRGKTATKAKWNSDGKILEVKAVSNFSGPNGEITTTTTEHWELAEGGKALKVHRIQETPRGTQESTYVFNKK